MDVNEMNAFQAENKTDEELLAYYLTSKRGNKKTITFKLPVEVIDALASIDTPETNSMKVAIAILEYAKRMKEKKQ